MTYKITKQNHKKIDVPLIAAKILNGAIAVFKSPQEDRYINSSDAFLWVLETFNIEISQILTEDNSHKLNFFIRKESLNRIVSVLNEAFDDYGIE